MAKFSLLIFLTIPMKNSNFVINVWDLLLSAGKKDEIFFENETIPEIEWLTKEWISWKIIIQSFNKESLLVTLEDVNCTIEEQCDKCTNLYKRTVNVDKYTARFQLEFDKEYDWDDEIFLIESNETIDIKEMVKNAILLQEPFTKKCEQCLEQDIKNWEIDDWDLDSFEWTGNINFR